MNTPLPLLEPSGLLPPALALVPSTVLHAGVGIGFGDAVARSVDESVAPVADRAVTVPIGGAGFVVDCAGRRTASAIHPLVLRAAPGG